MTGASMGIGAVSVSMLRLPLSCVLLATVLFAQNATSLTPLVIVVVVVSHVLTTWLAGADARLPSAPPPDAPQPA